MSGNINSQDGHPLAIPEDGTLILPGDGVPSVAHNGQVSAVQIGGQAYRILEHFPLAAGGTLPAPWATQDTSSSGTPTLDYADDAAGGQYILKLAADNEAEAITLYHGDQLTFDSTKKVIFEARVKIEPDVTGAGGDLAAGDIIVMGLAAARDATLDDITKNVWFRFEGANHNILVESDDGSTDDDDNDTGSDWVDDTWMVLKIVIDDVSAIGFYVDGVRVAQLAAAALTGNLQPFIEVSKAAAANFDHRVTIDYIDVIQQEL